MKKNEWDEIYKSRKQICRWPFSDLVSLVLRNRHRLPARPSVLEMGCGSGPNIPFFLENNFDYYAIEGANSIVEELKGNYPAIRDNIVCGDFSKPISFKRKFDLVFDRAAITHNTTDDIKDIVRTIRIRKTHTQ